MKPEAVGFQATHEHQTLRVKESLETVGPDLASAQLNLSHTSHGHAPGKCLPLDYLLALPYNYANLVPSSSYGQSQSWTHMGAPKNRPVRW